MAGVLDITGISEIATAWDATMAMITKALPTDEMRLEALKRRRPWRYAQTRMMIERRIFRQIRKEAVGPITDKVILDFVNWDNADLPDTEKQLLVKLLSHRFGVTNS